MDIINLHNIHHLGDSIYNLIYFDYIKDYIEKNNIIINYYCHDYYHDELIEFVNSSNIILKPLEEKGIHLWIDNKELFVNITEIKNRNLNVSYNDFFVEFYNNISKMLEIPITFSKFEYNDIKLIDRYNNLNDKYKNIDILIINSDACSGQYNKNEEEWNNYIISLNNNYNICTTKKVENVKCTRDDNLKIKDIAALSIKINILIAINTGVLAGLINSYTLNNIKKAYTIDHFNLYFNYNNFNQIRELGDIDLNEINNILIN